MLAHPTCGAKGEILGPYFNLAVWRAFCRRVLEKLGADTN